MATLTLRIPDDLDRELERQSLASRLSKSELVREALRRHLPVANLQALRTVLLPHAQGQDIITDEDVFRALNKS